MIESWVSTGSCPPTQPSFQYQAIFGAIIIVVRYFSVFMRVKLKLYWKNYNGLRLAIYLYCTAQIFWGYKFRWFCCFPAKRKNNFCKNEWTPIITWLNYACNLWNLFSVKSKFWQICKIYSPRNICAVQLVANLRQNFFGKLAFYLCYS